MKKKIPAKLRRLVVARAGSCCEYCRLSAEDSFFSFQVDHVEAEKHGGKTVAENLALSCPDCNAFKGTDIASRDPIDRELTLLYNPRIQRWSEHFRFVDATTIEGLTPEGRVTVFLLKLNIEDRLIEREDLIQMNRYPCATLDTTTLN